jgi:hypothetical protein
VRGKSKEVWGTKAPKRGPRAKPLAGSGSPQPLKKNYILHANLHSSLIVSSGLPEACRKQVCVTYDSANVVLICMARVLLGTGLLTLN